MQYKVCVSHYRQTYQEKINGDTANFYNIHEGMSVKLISEINTQRHIYSNILNKEKHYLEAQNKYIFYCNDWNCTLSWNFMKYFPCSKMVVAQFVNALHIWNSVDVC